MLKLGHTLSNTHSSTLKQVYGPALAMNQEQPHGPPQHGDHALHRWQPQPPPQEDHLENYIQRGSLDFEEKHALVDMIAAVAQRISPSWRDYRIVRHRARTALIHYIQNLDEGRHPLGTRSSQRARVQR